MAMPPNAAPKAPAQQVHSSQLPRMPGQNSQTLQEASKKIHVRPGGVAGTSLGGASGDPAGTVGHAGHTTQPQTAQPHQSINVNQASVGMHPDSKIAN